MTAPALPQPLMITGEPLGDPARSARVISPAATAAAARVSLSAMGQPLTERDTFLEVLGPAACLALLNQGHLGRLAFVERVGILPVIVPVSYLMHAGAVVFRTDEGSRLDEAIRGQPVALEVDGLDEVRGVGWSVVVRGLAEELTGDCDLEALGRTGTMSWAPADASHYVRVSAATISGRRIQPSHSWSGWWE